MLGPEDEQSLDADSDVSSDDFENENLYHYQDIQNIADLCKHLKDENQLAFEDEIRKKEAEDMEAYRKNRDGNIGLHYRGGDWASQPKVGLSNIFHSISFVDGVPQLKQLKVLSSTKQIIEKANEVLTDLIN